MTEGNCSQGEGAKKAAVDAPHRVVVVGAGIAGLTAAHELIERGFDVQVVEAEADIAGKPAIGGMARTQYALAPSPEQRSILAPDGFMELFESRVPRLTLAIKNPHAPEEASVQTFLQQLAHSPEWVRIVIAAKNLCAAQATVTMVTNLRPRPDIAILSIEDAHLATPAVVFVDGSNVPAEHGFRFFPSFYRHMFETMRRIPAQNVASLRRDNRLRELAISDSNDSIFDNLVAANEFHFALEKGRSWSLRRGRPKSIEEMRKTLRHLIDDMGYDVEDAARLTTRLLQYLLTSRARRRKELEQMTWLEYVETHRFVGRLEAHLRSAPQILAAMNSERGEARTIGSITMQLLLDQLRESEFVDALLNGPTSQSFLEPWRRYLRDQGVDFVRARLVGFSGQSTPGALPYVRPIFGVAGPAPACGKPHPIVVLPADYYVVTIPVDAFQSLWNPDGSPPRPQDVTFVEGTPAGAPLLPRSRMAQYSETWCRMQSKRGAFKETCLQNDVLRYLGFPLGDTSKPDDGAYRHMVGVQFYFTSDVRWVRGHTMLSDSPWSIALVSQPQFWGTKPRNANGYVGVISAAFTRFEVKGILFDKPAQECSRSEIAREVWAQIKATTGAPADVADPDMFYVDDGVEFSGSDGPFSNNRTRYLVNNAGDWERRGGRRVEDDYVYDVQVGNIVFGGVFMRTQTRLTSMEAANESGRRAVNAILDATQSQARRCSLFEMEAHEWEDGRLAHELDRKVLDHGGRHAMDGAATEMLMDAVPWKLVSFLRGDK